jgi:hypothetical protein
MVSRPPATIKSPHLRALLGCTRVLQCSLEQCNLRTRPPAAGRSAHPGLVDAIAATLPGASWQRCRTHFMRNLLTRVPRSAQSFVATMVRSIFAQPVGESVHEQHARIVGQLDGRFPEAAALLEEAGPEFGHSLRVTFGRCVFWAFSGFLAL